MKKLIYLFILIFGFNSFAFGEDTINTRVSQLSKLQKIRSMPKLYVPNFVLINEDAIFKVVTRPNLKIKLVVDYGANIPIQEFQKETNETGIVAFNVHILKDDSLIGKSVAVDAFVIENDEQIKAVIQNENGTIRNSNRIYITDNEADKGFLFAPWQTLNTLIMNYGYDENSGYNPAEEQIYTNNTPIYIRNMRDAQDNVREIPTNPNYSN